MGEVMEATLVSARLGSWLGRQSLSAGKRAGGGQRRSFGEMADADVGIAWEMGCVFVSLFTLSCGVFGVAGEGGACWPRA